MAKGIARSGFDIDLEDGLFEESRLASILRLKGNLIEVKWDDKCSQTGNLFIEISQPDGRGGRKKSGLAITESNWWAAWITPEASLLVTTDSLREFCREKWTKAKQQGRKLSIRGGDNNGYEGILINMQEFVAWLLKRFKSCS